MKTRILTLFILCALAAESATIPFSASTTGLFFDSLGSTLTESISFNGFNPAFGTLNSISLTLAIEEGPSTVTWTFQNQTTHSIAGATVVAGDSIALKKGATSISSTSGTSTPFGSTLAVGAFLTQSHVFGADGSGTRNVSAANRAFFVGAGLVTFDVIGTGLTSTPTSGLTFISSSGTVPYTVTVSGLYNYTPKPVPEPSALQLFFIGGIGIALGIVQRTKK